VRPGVFASEDLKPGEHFDWVPADTGTFTYRCTIHSRMRGKVIVK
jgi:plastocyanin